MSLDKSTCIKFYKRREVQEALVAHALNKEIGMRYGESFGKRPDVLSYPQDVLELALQGVTSFHASEELWRNPLGISSSLSKKEVDDLRVGWDLLLDIDCAVFEYSRICAYFVVEFLRNCGVRQISVKFSGNKGFHIGVPFEAFPKRIGTTLVKDMFPDAPRKIAFYVKENIQEHVARMIMSSEQGNLAIIKHKVGKEGIILQQKNKQGDIVPVLDVESFLEIDTILLASRHLYRMPYSLHEKSGLVSVPVDPEKIMEFEKAMAHPSKVIRTVPFLNRNVADRDTAESARQLLQQAWDYAAKAPVEKVESLHEDMKIESPIREEFFPPCMQGILNGLEDGKKRGVFCLINFLGKLGWSKSDIEEYVHQWNQDKNRVPLREVYIKGQLEHFTPGERLPPNCDNEGYYKSIGVKCADDAMCRRVKNPVNYTMLKWRRFRQQQLENEEKGKRRKKGDVGEASGNSASTDGKN